MNNDRNEKPTSGFQLSEKSSVRGKRILNTTSQNKKEVIPGVEYNLTLPKLTENQVIVPDTLALVFNFKNSNTKSWFLNNLGRQLVKELRIDMDGEMIYENTGESIFETYKDLRKSDKERNACSNMVWLMKT